MNDRATVELTRIGRFLWDYRLTHPTYQGAYQYRSTKWSRGAALRSARRVIRDLDRREQWAAEREKVLL